MFRVISKYLVLGVILNIPVSTALGQSTLEKAASFNDPRMAKMRATFSENFGDIRDLSFSISATVWPNQRGSFNIFASFDEEPVFSQFIGNLGGRVKKRSAEFSLIFDLYSADRNCVKEETCRNSFNVRVIDNRDDSVLMSYGSAITCPSNQTKLHNSRYRMCPLEDQLFAEILMNLAN